MRSTTTSANHPEHFADLLELLGDVPLERIMARPAPGTATEADVVAAMERPRKRLCELVRGVLLEKVMGLKESRIGGIVFHHMESYLEVHDLGIAVPADGPLRLFPGLVYIPDVSFISDEQLVDGDLPEDSIPDLFPDLAVEVLSKGNTKREIERKLKDYFRAGTRVVWLIDRRKQIADVYTSPKKHTRLTKDQNLDGGDVLPGFHLPLRTLFAPRRRKNKS